MTRLLAIVAFLAVVPPGYGQQSTATGEATLREFAELVGNAAIKFGHQALLHLVALIPASPDRTETDETGRVRRLHEYFGEQQWHEDEHLAATTEDVVSYWVLQTQRFDYDHGKVRSGDRTWQSVPFTWNSQKGVCRDSATLLADMLAHKGYDARLVLGHVVEPPIPLPLPDTGHAWVVLKDEETGHEYLLESTKETWDEPMRVPPRTFTKVEYIPEMQVTANHYYTRSSIGRTTDYSQDWKKEPAN